MIHEHDLPRPRRGSESARRGKLGEAIAALYLEISGYRVLRRNLRRGPLEIDLVAEKGRTLAFIEVRFRSSRTHGRPEETVRWRKRRNLVRAVGGMIADLQVRPGARIRIDLIAIERQGYRLTLRHYPGWCTFGGSTAGAD